MAVSFACLPPMWKVMVCPCNAQSLGDTIRPWYLPLYVLTVSDRHQLTLAWTSIPFGAGLPPMVTLPAYSLKKGGSCPWPSGSGVGVGVDIGRGVGVAVGVGVGVGVAVGSGVGVGVAVGSGVGVAVGRGVDVGAGVGMGVGVGAGVSVGTGVGTGVAVGTAVGAGVSVGIGVGVSASPPHAASSRIIIRSRLKPSLVRFTE